MRFIVSNNRSSRASLLGKVTTSALHYIRARPCPTATAFLSGRLLAAAAAAGPRRRFAPGGVVDLLDLEYLDAAVGPPAEVDGHVLRHEGAADADPLLLPVDQVALQVWHVEERSPDPPVAPVAVDAHPHRHAVVELLLLHPRHKTHSSHSKRHEHDHGSKEPLAGRRGGLVTLPLINLLSLLLGHDQRGRAAAANGSGRFQTPAAKEVVVLILKGRRNPPQGVRFYEGRGAAARGSKWRSWVQLERIYFWIDT